MRRNLIIVAAVAVMAASGGYFAAMVLSPRPPAQQLTLPQTEAGDLTIPAPENLVGQRRPDFVLEDTAGRTVSADSFAGRVMLVNFWATWCTPCTEEMPMLSRLQQEYADRGLAVVGIALDDPERARTFARNLGVDYPVLFGLADAVVVGRRYGNRSGMLPYSVLVDAEGIIRWMRLGVLDRAQLDAQLATLQQGGRAR